MKNKQITMIKFLLRYPETWHSFSSDRETVEIVCSLCNLGIMQINQYNQMILKSRIKAYDFINN